MVEKYEMQNQIMISSFKYDILQMFKEKSNFITSYLYNNFETEALPSKDIYTWHGNMIGCDIKYLCQEVIENSHAAGQKVSVFFSYLKEKEDYYPFLISLGVDVIISD